MLCSNDRMQLSQVVAAIIERDRRILICRRRPEDPHPLKWEFPGGKVEPQETPYQALERELQEELGIEVTRADEMERYEFQYPGRKPILLIFFRVLEFTGTPCNLVFHEIRWEPAFRLPGFDFLEGDLDFVARLAR
jgi:8-oxo-dGTP diphosphatase